MSAMILPITDFNRIHQIIHGTLKDEGNPSKACTLFACIGSMILNKHYKIPARVVAGGFAMCVEPENILFFGKKSGNRVSFDQDGFHMWIQTETHIIDFMSPLFNEAIAEDAPGLTIPRRMFQKRLLDEAKSLDDLNAPGDFYAMGDPELSDWFLDRIVDRSINRDFIEIADHWFGKRRGKQKPSMTIGGSDGEIRELRLANTVVNSAW